MQLVVLRPPRQPLATRTKAPGGWRTVSREELQPVQEARGRHAGLDRHDGVALAQQEGGRVVAARTAVAHLKGGVRRVQRGKTGPATADAKRCHERAAIVGSGMCT